MEDCFDNIRTEDLDNCVNDELASGVSETELFYAPAAHIDTMPSLPALGDPTKTLAEIATVSGDITFPTGKGFNRLNILADTGEIKDEPVGNKGNKKVKSSFEFFLSNNSARNLGFIRQYKNVGLVLVIVEKSGRKRILGSKLVPAYIAEASGTSGKGSEDDVGFQITIDVTKSAPAPVYTGNIVSKPAETTTTT